eukprot:scaffold62776_cov17-Tisochrysis_lutea.AAC.1
MCLNDASLPSICIDLCNHTSISNLSVTTYGMMVNTWPASSSHTNQSFAIDDGHHPSLYGYPHYESQHSMTASNCCALCRWYDAVAGVEVIDRVNGGWMMQNFLVSTLKGRLVPELFLVSIPRRGGISPPKKESFGA